MRWPLLMAFVPVLFAQAARAAAPEAPADPLIFYVSFDKDYMPDKSDGPPNVPFVRKDSLKYAPGKVNNAVTVARDAQLVYDALGNAYMAAGTVSFFWRPDADPNQGGFLVLDMSPLERINFSRFFKITYGNKVLAWDGTLGNNGKKSFQATESRGKIEQGQWHHVALTWDQSKGVALYFDGAKAGELKAAWSYDGNFNHIGLGLETRPDFRPDGARFPQSYDELRVYDRWLDDAAIKTLAEGKVPQVGPLDPTPLLNQRRAIYGWENAASLQPVAVIEGQGLGLRQVGVASAVDVKRSSWNAFDGERGRSWPTGGGYFDSGRALDFSLFPGQAFDVVQIHARGELRFKQSGNDNPIADVTSQDLVTEHLVLSKPIAGEKFVVERTRETPGRLLEMNLFERVPFAAKDGDEAWQRVSLAPVPPAATQPAEMAAVHRLHYTCDQQALIAADAPGQGPFKFPAMRAVHVLGPSHAERQGLAGIALDLVVMGNSDPNVLRVEVIDPINPERYWTTADVRVTGAGGHLRFSLDARDMVFQPGARPRLVLTFRNDTNVDMAKSRVAYKWASVKDAIPEFAHDELARAKDVFQEVSEARPWGYPPTALRACGFLLNIFEELHAIEPEDGVVSSYWHWVKPREPKTIIKFPEIPAGIPAWAVYLDGAIDECKKMPYWWINHRENSTGEFGPNDGINDDTDLVQDWWALYLMRGPDPVLFQSLRRVAENSWYNKMNESGLGGFTDALHTYEDGMNAQCHMAMMDYGNPVYMERLFKSAQHYKNLLAVYPKDGHLHFRGSHYGRDAKGNLSIQPDKYGWDDGDNGLALQPGMLIGWYNGNAYCRKIVVDWIDGMMAHDMSRVEKDHRLVGVAINTTTGEEHVSDAHVSFGYGFWSVPWAAYEFTGDKKYLEFIKLGMERDMKDYRHIRQTSCVGDRYVQETGDKSLAAGHLAAAKLPVLWKQSIHNDDYLDIEAFYYAWQCTGDLNVLTEGIKLTLNDITWELPMLTEGEQSTDRVWLPQRLINHVALGGAAMLRNETYPKHAVSWENATGHIAPMFKTQDHKHFETWIVNLEDKPVSVNMRIWGLEHGRYEFTEGLDANQDQAFEGQTQKRTLEIARFDTVPVTIPPRSVWYVVCKQVEKLEDVVRRADLAVCTNDAGYDAKTNQATVRIHNIGSKPAAGFNVRISVNGKVVVDKKVDSLESPDDMMPRIIDFQVNVPNAEAEVSVEVDAANTVPEITRINNAIKFVPGKLPPAWPITRKQR